MKRLGLCQLLPVILIFASDEWLVAQTSEGKRIASVTFEPADQPLTPSDLVSAQKLKPGAVFHAADATETISALFDTGRYDDIQIETSDGEAGQLAVRIVTTMAWFTGHVGIEGKLDSPPTDTQLIDTSRLALGAPFRDEDIRRAQRSLKRLLERNGFYEAQISVKTSDRPDIQQRDVTFVVKHNHRARYGEPVIQGEPILPPGTIIRATGWRYRFIGIWRQVTQERTRRGVLGVLKRYQKDDRLTAAVRNEELTYDPKTRRVTSTLDLEAGPKVDIRAVEAKVSKRRLKKYVPVYDELAVNRDLLLEGARNLRDYFQSDGYYEAEVEFRERDEDADHHVIEYVVTKGNRYKLVNIEIAGNKYFKTEDLRERMFLTPATFIRFRRGRYSEAFLDRDQESIVNLYRSNGFREAKVVPSVEKDYKGKTGDVSVTLRVEEGPQWLVGDISFEGVESLDTEVLGGRLTSFPDQPYSEINVAGDRNVVITALNEAGFPDATFQWHSTEMEDAHRVNLVYTVVEGRRQFVRDIVITGVKTTRKSMIDRNVTMKAGDPLSQVQISDMQRRLYQLGLFGRVDVAIQNPAGSSQEKYVLYDIREASRYSLALGFGAEFARIGGTSSDLSTPSGKTGFSPRVSVDLSRLNFLGLGHTISLRGRVSNLEQVASFNYLAPRFRNVEGRNVTFTTLYSITRDVRTFSSRRQEASIQISQQLTRASNLLVRFGYRRVTTGSVAIPSLLIPALLQPVRIGSMSANFVNDRRNNPADTRRGIYTTADLSLASGIFGSQRSFVRGLFRNATYHPVTKTLVLARETTFGMILPFHIPSDVPRADYIPLPERFYGGGGNTHRGLPQNQAGPRDIGPNAATGDFSQATGFPIGGNALFFNQTELRFPLLGDNIGGVAFHDFGNIFSTIGDFSVRLKQRDKQDFNYMVHAVGAGVRYKTPLGPVRVDLAYSINPPQFIGFKGTIQDLLNCGPSTASACQGTPDRIRHFQFFFSIGQTF